MYDKVLALKKQNPTLKVLIAVGGWNMGSAPFSDMAIDSAARAKFVSTSVKFLEDNGFDGLDLDWVRFSFVTELLICLFFNYFFYSILFMNSGVSR
jgi:hypothetical protein